MAAGWVTLLKRREWLALVALFAGARRLWVLEDGVHRLSMKSRSPMP
jgi:hypothetical protein